MAIYLTYEHSIARATPAGRHCRQKNENAWTQYITFLPQLRPPDGVAGEKTIWYDTFILTPLL
jgi:hypothetical protein